MNERHTQRGSICLEDAEVLSHERYPADQFVLRLQAPRCAARTLPGQFAHLSCDAALPMRRPLSIMRADPDAGWVEFLYKIVGQGSALLARRRPGDLISLLGPIGQPFRPSADRPRSLLIGGGVGIPPMICLAESLHAERTDERQPLVLMGSEIPFPFPARPSGILVRGIPPECIAAMPLLDDWGIPSRLASLKGYPGCYEGYVTDLARQWLQSLNATQIDHTEVFACGPVAMLQAVAALAREFSLPCQVSLEEHMACAVGGCAGCTVLVQTPAGPAMKRVCVDGPVFDAASVFPAAAAG
jgi:dihydroorotate dehydrogenase electron transfer subunit